MRSLYTPVLVVSMLALVRLTAVAAASVSLQPLPPIGRWFGSPCRDGCRGGLLSPPTLYAMARRAAEGWTMAPVLWRSSAPGVDLPPPSSCQTRRTRSRRRR